jgi:hypothetical protein
LQEVGNEEETTRAGGGQAACEQRGDVMLETLAALVPLPRRHLVRYGGCLAPHRRLRRLITPTPRQQGLEAPATGSTSPSWSWTSYRLSSPMYTFLTLFYLLI